MKKFSAAFLVFCLLISSVNFIFAADIKESSMEDLLISVKERVNIEEDEYEFDTYYENSYEETTSYTFSWKNKNDNSNNIRVEVLKDGNIVYYYKSVPSDYNVKFLKYSKDDAKVICNNFMKKIGAPDELVITDISKSGNMYHVNCERIHNGIKVSANYANCIISGESGEVTRYNIFWTDNISFKEENFITNESAEEIYKKELGYELFYIINEKDNQKTGELVYKPKYDENAYIDAVSGKVKTYSEFTEELSADKALASGGAAGNSKLSEKEIKFLEEIENLITPEEAVEIAKKTEEFKIDSNYSLKNSNIYKDGERYIITISLNEEKKDVYNYKTISYDAQTGKILGYNSYSNIYENKEKNKINNEKGIEIAEKFIEKYYSDEKDYLVPLETLSKTEGYYNYQRTENGIRVSNNGLRIGVDLKKGEIDSISFTWDKAEFENSEGIKNISEVYEKILTDKKLELSYLILSEKEENNKVKTKAVAVYRDNYRQLIDAFSLKNLDSYSLEEYENSVKPEYSDISGHYAEEKIKKLLENDIYLEGNEFMPEKAITNKEFISLVYMVFSGSKPKPVSELSKLALNYLDIEGKEEKEKSITRIEAIKILLDNMGYKEFAKIEGIFNCPFKDLTKEDEGYGAIASGLKLVSTEDEMFYGNSFLKRADAFIIIYNYMARK